MEIEFSKWFFDEVNPHLLQLHAFEGTIYSGKTKFQTLEIMKSPV